MLPLQLLWTPHLVMPFVVPPLHKLVNCCRLQCMKLLSSNTSQEQLRALVNYFVTRLQRGLQSVCAQLMLPLL